MYLLNGLLFPTSVIPLLPLALGLLFQIVGMLMILDVWEVDSPGVRLLSAGLSITYPGLAFLYSFAGMGYGIGIAFFCAALSLHLYARGEGRRKWFAVIPAVAALSIYQAFIIVLTLVFIVHLLTAALRAGRPIGRELVGAPAVVGFSAALYLVINRIIQLVLSLALDAYPSGLLISPNHGGNYLGVVVSYAHNLLRIYGGSKAMYSISMPLLALLVAFASVGLGIRIGRLDSPRARKLLAASLVATIFLLPLVSLAFMGGFITMRWLVGVPITLAALLVLAMDGTPSAYRAILSLVTVLCVFQFMQSMNHLFASSHIVMEGDRLLASALVERVQAAESQSGSVAGPRYLELVGIPHVPASELTPQIAHMGLSFFDIDHGSSHRVLGFLRTLGFEGLEEAPVERRIELIETANGMPAWPDLNSISIQGDTVLVKFADYTEIQKSVLCNDVDVGGPQPESGFCE
jgi:nitrate reductase NapE component